MDTILRAKPEAAFKAVRTKDAKARSAEVRLAAAKALEIRIIEAGAAEDFAKKLEHNAAVVTKKQQLVEGKGNHSLSRTAFSSQSRGCN